MRYAMQKYIVVFQVSKNRNIIGNANTELIHRAIDAVCSRRGSGTFKGAYSIGMRSCFGRENFESPDFPDCRFTQPNQDRESQQ
jgi:hypothetical protein